MVLHATAFSPCIYDDFSFPFFFILPLLSFCFVLVRFFFFERVGVIARLRGKELRIKLVYLDRVPGI